MTADQIWHNAELGDFATRDPGDETGWVRYVAAAQSPAEGDAQAGWHFARLQPSGTVSATAPDGRLFVVPKGRMDSEAGDALLNAMTADLTKPKDQAKEMIAMVRASLAASQSPAPGADDMLEPLIYAAIMHNGKPKTVADFERAAANVADMLKRRAAPPAVRDEPQDIGGHIRAAANAREAQQADDDTRRLDYLQKKQATISLVPDGRDKNGTRHAFMVGGWHCSVNRDVRASIDAAMGESQPPVQGKEQP